MDSKSELGLSSGNRKLIVGIFTALLILFGPAEPYGMLVRTASLIVLPTALWFSLGYFGKMWEADKQANDRLSRSIAGMLAGALFIGAFLSFTAHYHTECTQEIMTRDGSECVGDYITSKGNDISGMVMQIIFGTIAAWYSMAKHD